MKHNEIKIAIVEDHRLVRNGLKELIHMLDTPFRVVMEAADGGELLDAIAATGAPDLCILDIQMTGMDGFETMRRLTRQYPAVRGLALSIMTDEYPILRMYSNGARGYLPKNARPDELKRAIHEIMNDGFYYSDFVLAKIPKIALTEPGKLLKELFTERELEFLSLCCSDLTYSEICAKMFISVKSGEYYSARLRDKLGIESRLGLALYAHRTGIGTFRYENNKNPPPERSKNKLIFIPVTIRDAMGAYLILFMD